MPHLAHKERCRDELARTSQNRVVGIEASQARLAQGGHHGTPIGRTGAVHRRDGIEPFEHGGSKDDDALQGSALTPEESRNHVLSKTSFKPSVLATSEDDFEV